MLTYKGFLIAVKDISTSRHFYEGILQQDVEFDFGVNVSFKGGLAIHQKDNFHLLLGGDQKVSPVMKSHCGELYFETDNVDEIELRLKENGVDFIHPTCEQPWAQRVMRLYDPDGHVVEIGKTMDAVIWRLSQQGMTIEGICQKTGMLAIIVERVLNS